MSKAPPLETAASPALTKGQRSRAQLVGIAIRLFARDGFANTSFQAIADEAGLKQGALFYHFSNKDDLIEAVIGEVIARSRAFTAERASPEDGADSRLRKHFSAQLEFFYANLDASQIVALTYYMGANQPRFAAIYERIRAGGRESIRTLLLAGVREKVFTPKVPVEACVELLHDALTGAIINAVAAGGGLGGKSRVSREKADLLAKWDLLLERLLGLKA